MGIRDMKNNAGTYANLEMYGNKEVIVDGCKSVADYSGGYIKLDLGNKFLKISGNELTVISYVFEQADIKGEIVSLEFTTD